jgi:hypothetical protein
MLMKRILLLCGLALLSLQTVSAQDEKIQAIFLCKFIENINWSKDELVVGILGTTKVKDELIGILQCRKKNNIQVKEIDLTEVLSCDVVFLAENENSLCKSLMEITRKKTMLIVTEDATLIKKGAGISFVKEDNKVGFVVNKSSLDERSVKLSSTIIKMSAQNGA